MITMISLTIIAMVLFNYTLLRLKKELAFSHSALTAEEIKGILNNYNGFLFIIPTDMFLNNFYFYKRISLLFKQDCFNIVTLNLNNNNYDVNWEVLTALNAQSVPSIHYVKSISEIKEMFNFENVDQNSISKILAEIKKESINIKKWSSTSDYNTKSNSRIDIS